MSFIRITSLIIIWYAICTISKRYSIRTPGTSVWSSRITSLTDNTISCLAINTIIWIAIGSLCTICWAYCHSIICYVPSRCIIVAWYSILSVTKLRISVIEHAICLWSCEITEIAHVFIAWHLIVCVALSYINLIYLVTGCTIISVWRITINSIVCCTYQYIVWLAISYRFWCIYWININTIISYI